MDGATDDDKALSAPLNHRHAFGHTPIASPRLIPENPLPWRAGLASFQGHRGGAVQKVLSETSKIELRRHLDVEQIAHLDAAIGNLISSPPPDVPTLVQAREQLLKLHDDALGLTVAIKDSPWTVSELSRRAVVAGGTLRRVSPKALLEQLQALIAAARSAERDLGEQTAEPAGKSHGRRPDALVRGVVRLVLGALDNAGIPLTKTQNGVATKCCSTIFNDLQKMDSVALRFRTASPNHHVKEMLRGD